ncbi:hypothetical protein AB7M41_008682 [Bradyrhizobium diazoefficiens]
MSEPPELRALAQQELAAPIAAVATLAEAVEHQRQRRSREAMLRQDGSGMGMMVLDRDQPPSARFGEAGRCHVRVQVMDDNHRLDVQRRQQMADGFLEEADAFRGVEIADMLGDEGLVAARDRHGRLQRAADGQDRRHGLCETNRLGNVTTGAADEPRPPGDDRRHGIVGARDDVAVMGDDEIGDAGKAQLRLAIVDQKRLAAGIGAGGDGRPTFAGPLMHRIQRLEDQVMKRGDRQHDADPRQPRRNRRREPMAGRHQHDRPRRRFEQGKLGSVGSGDAGDRVHRANHHGKRLLVALLALPQPLHGRFVTGIADELVAAEPLDRDDFALRQSRRQSPRFRG